MAAPLITLLTDFGTADHYVAAMKGVISGICPEARLIDITHEIGPYGIAEAAFALGQTWKYFPAGSIHLVVVDPGVGSARRPILAEAGGHLFVAPDNGVLTIALSCDPNARVHQLTNERYFRTPVSRTFHGRDIFAPVAASLASGVPAAEFGPPVDDPVRLISLGDACQSPDGSWTGIILKADRYGNVVTSFSVDLIEKDKDNVSGPRDEWRLEIGPHKVTTTAASYAEAATGQLFVIAGSSGFLEISINQGSAAHETGAKVGDPVRLLRAGGMP